MGGKSKEGGGGFGGGEGCGGWLERRSVGIKARRVCALQILNISKTEGCAYRTKAPSGGCAFIITRILHNPYRRYHGLGF